MHLFHRLTFYVSSYVAVFPRLKPFNLNPYLALLNNVFRYLIPPVTGDMLYLGIVTTFIMTKLSGVLAEQIDPYAPLDIVVRAATG